MKDKNSDIIDAEFVVEEKYAQYDQVTETKINSDPYTQTKNQWFQNNSMKTFLFSNMLSNKKAWLVLILILPLALIAILVFVVVGILFSLIFIPLLLLAKKRIIKVGGFNLKNQPRNVHSSRKME